MTTRHFTGRFSCLEDIGTWVRQTAASAGFDAATAYQIETAVDEACSNVIEHAYGGESEQTFELSLLNDAENLTVVVRDRGRPFQPPKEHKPNLKSALEERDNHGLGLYFMQQWMDSVHYERRGGYNVLTMMRRLP